MTTPIEISSKPMFIDNGGRIIVELLKPGA
ncbi:hypothetical protein KR100_12310 [Synechococcus sp. KORDI-100]|nr:hypothetical protein KR100_12310 [Synechococcus sp. KORDI-100]